MEIYIARHGESVFNNKQVHQGKHVPLSQLGIDQSELLAQKVADLDIEGVETSDFTRTIQTSLATWRKLRKPIKITPLFGEHKRPTALEGRKYSDQEALDIREFIMENENNPHWHHSDEENFFDLRKRGLRAIEYLSRKKAESLLIFSHGIFMVMLRSVIEKGELLSPEQFRQNRAMYHLENTGLVHYRIAHERLDLVSWNDHSHLLNVEDLHLVT